MAMILLDGLSVAVQVLGLVLWPVTVVGLPNRWAFVSGLILTSCGWWESFVDQNSVDPLSKYLWRVKTSMQEDKSRFYTYLW